MKRISIMAGMSLLLLLLCGATRVAAAEAKLYLVEDLASGARHAPVRAQARELEAIYADLAEAAGVDAKFVYSTSSGINAFATLAGGEPVVVVQQGLLARFDGDRDAVAAVLGHELAHHKADHVRGGQRRKEGVRVLGTILGAVVGAKVGHRHGELAGALGGATVGVGAGLLALKFNRSQELEADHLALKWMIEAGYNPQGMLRLQQQLGKLEGTRRAAMLSTHPTGARRYRAAQALITRLAPAPELLARAVQPLVDEAALVAAAQAIAAPEAVPAPPAANGAAATRAALAADGAAAATPARRVDRDQARAAGVHFGTGVQVGGNVRVGGQPVQVDTGNSD